MDPALSEPGKACDTNVIFQFCSYERQSNHCKNYTSVAQISVSHGQIASTDCNERKIDATDVDLRIYKASCKTQKLVRPPHHFLRPR